MPISAYERIKVARDINRPTSIYYINSIFDNFLEFHGDRAFRDDPSIVGGIAQLNGRAVTIIGQEKGSTIEEKAFRNFGAVHPEGYRKALRLMNQAEKFNRPIICLVDTQGAYCGVGAEERGQGEAIARNLKEMMQFTVPVICVIIGEGGSGGALALAVSNKVFMLENAVYSILSPEGFASILWKDASRAAEAAEVMKMTAEDLFKMGIIDDIIPEPKGGAQTDPKLMAQTLKEKLVQELDLLSSFTPEQLKVERYKKFRKF
jgi:acetyl-CoA carboxylase carboxyl transferase subunit alpha